MGFTKKSNGIVGSEKNVSVGGSGEGKNEGEKRDSREFERDHWRKRKRSVKGH